MMRFAMIDGVVGWVPSQLVTLPVLFATFTVPLMARFALSSWP